MVMILAFFLTLAVPTVLRFIGNELGAPSKKARKVVFGISTALSLTAAMLWHLGLDALPIVILAYAPVYQMELLAWVLKRFKRNYGREMRLVMSAIVVDPELKKDGRYASSYFASAVCVPLLLSGFLISWTR